MSGSENDAVLDGIRGLKAKFGRRILIAAHHYQSLDVVALSDIVGDSYALARLALASEAEFIILCGVLFMAESAAILAREGQVVLSPDPGAGCPMADMIDRRSMEASLGAIRAATGSSAAPIVYMNSTAGTKALAGERDGSVCTSGNAAAVVRALSSRGRPIFFAPDRNLGANTAAALGLDPRRVFLVGADRSIRGTGNPAEGLLFLWDGFCCVHKRFTVADVAAARAASPGVRVIVHPECDPEVVEAADDSGSTERLWQLAAEASPRSSFVVGTESNFVRRLAAAFPDRTVAPLRESPCLSMSRITAASLFRSLESIRDAALGKGRLVHEVTIDEISRANASKALKAMIALTEAGR